MDTDRRPVAVSSGVIVRLAPLARRVPALVRCVAGAHATLFLWTNGRLLGRWFGTPVLILETIGRRSGQQRTTPLVYLRDGEDLVVVPANGGAPREPGWLLNLRAAGVAVALIGRDRFHVRPREATGSERERLWRRLAAVTPVEAFQRQARRRLPVVVLTRISSDEPEPRRKRWDAQVRRPAQDRRDRR